MGVGRMLVGFSVAACGRLGFDASAIEPVPGDSPIGGPCASDLDCPVCARCEVQTCQAEPIGDVFLGHRLTCFLGGGGSRWCAGENQNAALGLGIASAAQPRFSRVVGEEGWTRLFLGYERSAGLRSGTMWSWGGSDLEPVDTQTSPAVQSISQEAYSSCTWNTDNTLSCDPTGAMWTTFDEGDNMRCAIKADRTMFCWGTDSNGSLGLGNLPTPQQMQTDPVQVGTDSDWVAVGAGRGQGCAIKTNGTLWCWGQAELTGTNNVATGGDPTQVGTDTDWAEIWIDWERACAVKMDRSVWCFGKDTYGGFVVPGAAQAAVPTLVGGPFDRWLMGGHHSCGQRRDGRWSCFGWNAGGQLGVGHTDEVTTFVDLCQ